VQIWHIARDTIYFATNITNMTLKPFILKGKINIKTKTFGSFGTFNNIFMAFL
jgi:hypothetical protein